MSEVAVLCEANQFQAGKSQFMCGFYAVAMAASMAPPGKQPAHSQQQIIETAIQWYGRYNGNTSIMNNFGMTTEQLYAVLHDAGLRYQATSPDVAHILAWLRLGFPLIVAVYEANVFDLALGDYPYPWSPAGSHVIVITGEEDGLLLVRDSANCTNLYDPSSLRPGPRHYDLQRLSSGLITVTAIVPPWKPRPPAGFDPTQEKLLMTPAQPTIPAGWYDDGTTLYAPNKLPIVHGFRDYVLTHSWDKDNWPLASETGRAPLELSNPALGSGTQQIFRYSVLEWTKERGVFVAWVGQELLAERDKQPPAQGSVLEPELRKQLSELAQTLQPLWSAYNGIQELLKGK